jgi:meso-butanediol dehydrogenase/(S,S)-butanediol dehydrogenase/diacetyl reductase
MPDAWIDFSGKIAAVTGAASGIGRATARLLAGFGAEVLLLDRNVDGAQVAAAEISSTGGKASAHALDVTSETEWQSIGQLVASRYSRLDVLVNSAGIATFDRVDDAMFDTYRRAFAINVEGSLHGMAMALGFMRAAGKGAIVNLASTAALKGNPGMASYGASKAAIAHFTRSAACELNRAGLDVRVNAVMPGFTETAMASMIGSMTSSAAARQHCRCSQAVARPIRKKSPTWWCFSHRTGQVSFRARSSRQTGRRAHERYKPRTLAALSCRNLGQTSSLNGTASISSKIRVSSSPIGK